MNDRDGAIDALRAFMVLYIVGYWHLMAYVGTGTSHVNETSTFVKMVVLGTFTLISGLLLGRSRIEFSVFGWILFWRKRFIRLYPLYALALIGLVLLWLTKPDVAWRAAWLGSLTIPPAPMTLWFATMIMLFYLITPPLLRISQPYVYVVIIALWLLAIAWHVLKASIDLRLTLYFPCFAIGLILGRNGTAGQQLKINWMIVLFGISIPLAMIQHSEEWRAMMCRTPLVLLGSLTLLAVGSRTLGRLGTHRIITELSYCSLALYLFHRHVFTGWFRLVEPHSAQSQLALALLVALPSSIMIAWFVQRGYDRLLSTKTPLFKFAKPSPTGKPNKENDR
jgi:peptidoglycan/LPS O-acetylase OafA/YrhL